MPYYTAFQKLVIEKLQRVQNLSARLITGSYKYDHITPLAICKTLLNCTLQTNSKKFQWQTNFVYPESENTLWGEVF